MSRHDKATGLSNKGFDLLETMRDPFKGEQSKKHGLGYWQEMKRQRDDLLVALKVLREQIESLEGFLVTRDIDQHKALANWDSAIAQADAAIAAAHASAPSP